MRSIMLWLGLLIAVAPADERSDYVRNHYTKSEVRITMRDGKRLFTAIFAPNDLDPQKSYPILFTRTPYSVGPYGVDKYKPILGPSVEFEKSGYIFVFQDVRGRYMSEGEFVNMRPHIQGKRGQQIDESSDTYDTMDWLVKNVPRNNSRVGMYGISYPGYYTSAGAIDSHPALVAASPQAPIADWFFDDFHRNGAFVLPMGFGFFSGFGQPRPEPTPIAAKAIEPPTRDGYQFFLDLGPLSNVDRQYFHDEIGFWNDIEAHPNYDAFWQDRNLLPHLKKVGCAVLTVGGWYDTEDLYGPLSTYAAIEAQNPNTENRLVMGPWYHGAWSRDEARTLGQADFGFATGQWYREHVQFPFFEYHLKQKGELGLAEATVFETGANRWRQFDQWPPKSVKKTKFYMSENHSLSTTPPTKSGDDAFISDPSKPVPYTQEITTRWARDYVTEDQRFAAWRPDVLVYRGPKLEVSQTIAGPIDVDLWVKSTGSDADWIVKIIDEFPGEPIDGTKYVEEPGKAVLSGRQELVRAGVIRGRFRDGFDKAVPMKPGEPTRVRFELSDIMHTFRPGHRLMIQVQSTWFPFIDRNPQKFVPNIFQAKQEDFITATHSVLRAPEMSSHVSVSVMTE
ncbi:MAG: CocE/NonD family hydrolase [Pirellulaceae bacterium]|nr:CocE/NonD family hydrolase [Pirellulaceae bacterium]